MANEKETATFYCSWHSSSTESHAASCHTPITLPTTGPGECMSPFVICELFELLEHGEFFPRMSYTVAVRHQGHSGGPRLFEPAAFTAPEVRQEAP